MGEFFVNPLGAAELMTYLGATGQSVTGLAAALFPAAAGTDIDIGGSSISVAESLLTSP